LTYSSPFTAPIRSCLTIWDPSGLFSFSHFLFLLASGVISPFSLSSAYKTRQTCLPMAPCLFFASTCTLLCLLSAWALCMLSRASFAIPVKVVPEPFSSDSSFLLRRYPPPFLLWREAWRNSPLSHFWLPRQRGVVQSFVATNNSCVTQPFFCVVPFSSF